MAKKKDEIDDGTPYFPFPRDTKAYDLLNNYERPKNISYEYMPLSVKHNLNNCVINYIYNLIELGNSYEDILIIPDYQRGLVWTKKQKQNLIMSVLMGNPIGDFVFGKKLFKDSRGEVSGLKVEWTVIDGQQRLNALKEFVGNKFPLPDGKYFKDMKYWDVKEFLSGYRINAVNITNLTYDQEVEVYWNRNFGGTAHSRAELDRIKKLREELK